MNFILFILLNATLFIRPAEIVPALTGLPIYNVQILTCLALSIVPVFGQLNGRNLRDNPVTACVLGLLAAVVMSHLAHGQNRLAVEAGTEFGKVVVYYLLMVSVLKSPARLTRFLTWLLLFIFVLTVLAVFQYHGIINVPSLEAYRQQQFDEASGEESYVMRMCSTGMYNDPNDLCMILLVGMVLCVYRMDNRRSGLFRAFWLAPLTLFGYALMMTHSRGGFLAMLVALFALLEARFGWRKSVPLAALALPVALMLFAGRQTTISSTEDTAQARIQLWAEGMALFRSSPVFGIGYNRYAEEVGLLAHNSFVNTYTDLGFSGGFLFLGAFFYGFWTLHRIAKPGVTIANPELKRLRPYLVSIVAAYVGGMLTLSRAYIVPTYMVLGMATSYIRHADIRPGASVRRFDIQLVGQFVGVSVLYLLATKAFIALFARWG